MKTAKDPRHINRVRVMQELFAVDFSPKNHPKIKETKDILTDKERIDRLIASAAPAWPIGNINKIDLSILRLAVYELTNKNESASIPPKVVVDEAVEIAKEYGSSSSPSFVNGVLGKLISLQTL